MVGRGSSGDVGLSSNLTGTGLGDLSLSREGLDVHAVFARLCNEMFYKVLVLREDVVLHVVGEAQEAFNE